MLSNKTTGYLSYHHFRLGAAFNDYQLSISRFSGNTTDPITGSHSLNNIKFTTRDRDNDEGRINCAVYNSGGKIIVPIYFPIISTITSRI